MKRFEKMIGKIQRVGLREVWKHEAFNFTDWLKNNLDVLNDVLDIGLTNGEKEQAAGDFSCDLVAQDMDGDRVIIENQLEQSDHNHLGKVLTYLTALEAKTAIWVVKDARPEHIGAISWLNESSNADFYLVKVEGMKIGDSEPAPLFTLVVGPSEETREIGRIKKDWKERDVAYNKFFTQLLERAKAKTKLHANISPGHHHWVGAGSGLRGVTFNYVIRANEASAEIYIDKGDKSENKGLFDQLHSSKSEIEKTFGGALDWERLENRRACRIEKVLGNGGWQDEAKWPGLQDAMIDAMMRLERALAPEIGKLKAE